MPLPDAPDAHHESQAACDCPSLVGMGHDAGLHNAAPSMAYSLVNAVPSNNIRASESSMPGSSRSASRYPAKAHLFGTGVAVCLAIGCENLWVRPAGNQLTVITLSVSVLKLDDAAARQPLNEPLVGYLGVQSVNCFADGGEQVVLADPRKQGASRQAGADRFVGSCHREGHATVVELVEHLA